jgi:hypothetical protein
VTTPQEPRRRRHAGPPQSPYGQPAPGWPPRQGGEPLGYERPPAYGQGGPQPSFTPRQDAPRQQGFTGPMPPPGQQPYTGYGPGMPPGTPPRKRHTARNVILSGLGLLVVIIVIASVASSGGGSGSPAAAASSAPAAASSAPAAARPAAGAAGIGQAVHDGDFAFTVRSLTCGASAAAAVEGSDGFGEKIPSGAVECLATMTVTDDKAEAQTFFDSNQYAYDKAGRKLSADSDGAIYMSGSQDATQLNPGITITAQVPFQIPAGDSIVSLGLHDSAFSGGVTVQVAR